MTVQVSKASVFENIFKNFYDIISAISGFSNIVYPTFPETVLDAKADYPVVVINPPEISWDTFTFGKNMTEGTIAIDVYRTTPKDSDLYASDISDQIETSKTTLAGVGLQMVTLESSTANQIPHGKIKVFMQTLIFNYKFTSVKTFAF